MPSVGSLFSGVGGFDLGFEQAGFQVAWQVEIDRDAVSVLERHWPAVPRYGDIATVDPAVLAPVDVVVFGSPCQDFSVAGKRAGLDGARSGLFGEAIRIIRGLHPAPALCVWENVPGTLSSSRGRDFGAVLDALAGAGALDICWRILDARWFGVPQRRRRLFVVSDFRSERASSILFEPQSSNRHPAARREAGETTARDAESSAREPLFIDAYACRGSSSPNQHPVSASGLSDALDTTGPGGVVVPVPAGGAGGVSEPVVYQCHGNNVGAIGTLRQGNGGLTGGVPFVATSVTASAGHHGHSSPRGDGSDNLVVAAPLTAGGHPNSNAPGRHREDDENLVAVPIDLRQTSRGELLTNNRAHGSGGPPGVGVGEGGDPAFTVSERGQAVAFDWQGGGGGNDESFRGKSRSYVVRAGDYAGSVGATKHDAVAFHLTQDPIDGAESPALGAGIEHGCATVAVGFYPTGGTHGVSAVDDGMPSLKVGKRVDFGGQAPALAQGMAVRRLTPRECERLMGWPDSHTAYRADGSEIPDGPRYRMIGNGVVAPVARWLAERMLAALEA